MKYYLTQHYTKEMKSLYDLSIGLTEKYASDNGFEYISNNGERRCEDRPIYWEKIAWLNYLLSTIDEGSYVVYQDYDSLNVNGDLKDALHDGYEIGMVHLRGGLGNRKVLEWFNSGIIILINTKDVRNFLQRVWERGGQTDEDGLNGEIQSNNGTIGNGKVVASLDPSWNCWRNNEGNCKVINIKTWHGMSYQDKLSNIKEFIKDNKLSL